jgi:hypothetical protein
MEVPTEPGPVPHVRPTIDARHASPPLARMGRAALLLTAAAAVFWFGLEMQRGLLLSEDVKSRVWPWAPSFPSREIVAPALSDPVWQFVPWLELARREIGSGRLPLWNPYQNGGAPLLGNGQSALGSPLVWPILAFGVAGGWNLSLLLRLLVAFGGALLWLRDLGRSRSGAILGATMFALSGPFVAWLEHPETPTLAPLPLLLFFARRVARNPSRGSFLGLALTTYFVISGGQPESALLAALLAAAVTLRESKRLQGTLAAISAAIIGAGLAAPFLFPFIEYLALSDARAGEGRHPFVLSLHDLLRFVLVTVPGSNVIEAAAAVSLTALMLVAGGLALVARRSDLRFWAVAAGVMLLVTYDNPIARALALHTPMYWTRALLLLPLALGAIASASIDRLREMCARRGLRVLEHTMGPATVVLVAVELLLRAQGVHGHAQRDDLARSTPLLERLRSEPGVFRVLPLHTFLPPESATTYGLEDVRGYDALGPRGWRERRREIGRFTRTPTVTDVVEPWDIAEGGQGLDFWNVRYLLLHPGFDFGMDVFRERLGLNLEEIYSGPDGRILLNRRAQPRARLEGAGRVEIERRLPTSWRLSVDAEAATRLTVANPFFPGWTARIDGVPTALAAQPGSPLEFAVPAGRHRVDLVYRPPSFLVGCIVALACAVALLLVCFRLPVRKTETPRT